MSNIDKLTPEEALAESIVDEALAGMAIPPELLPLTRVTMICELLTTPAGRVQLRRAMKDAEVSRSDEVVRPGAPAAKPDARPAAEKLVPGMRAGSRKPKGRG